MFRKKDKLICGWGINDVDYYVTQREFINGKFKITWVCPYYIDWRSMIERCNIPKYYPNYIDCTICCEWKYFSNFIRWVDNQGNTDWENCSPDKDFLVEGNKHYSPDTVVYIDRKLNHFITDSRKARGDLMIGVSSADSRKNPYKADCNNPLTGKREYLGLFSTELEAHLAWKAKKHEIACIFAETQQDERVAKRLREMYTPDTDLTNK